MKPLNGKELCKILERNGWTLRRIHGSHHIYTKEGMESKISVPVHGNKELKRGLVNHILKIANLSENDL
jgi:predicted RNA binding protein YcfA (HicA-like mRNA interferase family)